ncbi:hypothetical protein ACGFNP_22135 [Nonomuraea sp. NPDC049269]
MSNFSLSVQVPGEWGRHVVIMIVIVIAVTLGVDVADVPFRV